MKKLFVLMFFLCAQCFCMFPGGASNVGASRNLTDAVKVSTLVNKLSNYFAHRELDEPVAVPEQVFAESRQHLENIIHFDRDNMREMGMRYLFSSHGGLVFERLCDPTYAQSSQELFALFQSAHEANRLFETFCFDYIMDDSRQIVEYLESYINVWVMAQCIRYMQHAEVDADIKGRCLSRLNKTLQYNTTKVTRYGNCVKDKTTPENMLMVFLLVSAFI